MEEPARSRGRGGHRLPDRGVDQRPHVECPGKQQPRYRLQSYRSLARDRALLQGRGDQPAWMGRLVECGERHDEPTAGEADGTDGQGQGDIEHRAGLECPVIDRRHDHRLPHRGIPHRHHPLDGARGRHGSQSHRIHPHRPQPRHHPPLPRFGDQHGGQRPLVERRQRNHRCHRSGRTLGPQRGCERFAGKRPVAAQMDASGHGRRERDHGLPDPDVPHRRLGLDTGRGQHPKRRHDLPAHRSCPRHDPVLPRGRDQQGGQKRFLGRTWPRAQPTPRPPARP